jgi:transposase
VVYTPHFQFLAEKRVAYLMAGLFGVNLTTVTIASMSRNCTGRFAGVAAAVRDHVAAAPVKHLDETGFRLGGKMQWLHIVSTILLTFYRISSKPGRLPEGMTGIVVHDRSKPYYTPKDVLHALCNAHYLRELPAPIEIEKEVWAHKIRLLLRRARHAANVARDRDAPLSSR